MTPQCPAALSCKAEVVTFLLGSCRTGWVSVSLEGPQHIQITYDASACDDFLCLFCFVFIFIVPPPTYVPIPLH